MAYHVREPRSEAKPTAIHPDNTVQIRPSEMDYRVCGLNNCRTMLPLPEPLVCPGCGQRVRPEQAGEEH